MPREIERKFLIDVGEIELPSTCSEIKQGYIPVSESTKTVVRVRVKDDAAYLTIKGENIGAVRSEFEYAIPVDHALQMLQSLCQKPLIEKTRYDIPIGEFIWELDYFHGENEGLVVAEIELSEEDQDFDLPGWVKREVTDDPRYFNSNLLKNPYSQWRGT